MGADVLVLSAAHFCWLLLLLLTTACLHGSPCLHRLTAAEAHTDSALPQGHCFRHPMFEPGRSYGRSWQSWTRIAPPSMQFVHTFSSQTDLLRVQILEYRIFLPPQAASSPLWRS